MEEVYTIATLKLKPARGRAVNSYVELDDDNALQVLVLYTSTILKWGANSNIHNKTSGNVP